jgi:hypothetical protein
MKKMGESRHEYERRRGANVFTGVFMVANLSSVVNSDVYILPTFNEVGKLLKGIASGLNAIAKSNAPEVKIGNKDFQERFEVYSENTDEVVSLVSESIMNEMVRIKKEHNEIQVYASFIENKVFVAIENAKGLFDPKIKTSLLDAESAEEIFKNLLTYLNVLRMFALKG